jgi:hypothetical protein
VIWFRFEQVGGNSEREEVWQQGEQLGMYNSQASQSGWWLWVRVEAVEVVRGHFILETDWVSLGLFC